MSPDRLERIVAFATIGTVSTTQQIAGTVLSDIEAADPDLVAEETLSLVATATSRAVAVGLKSEPDAARQAADAVMEIPFLYRDYLLGCQMLAEQDPSLAESAGDVYARLQRKREFYSVHLPPNQFPGDRVLTDKMGLWMGRISPPGLPELPTKRLEKLDLVSGVLTHLKLVLSFAKSEE